MPSFNKIQIIGHLGRDPELRYTPAGDAVCDFSVATNTRRRNKSGEWEETPTWFRVTCFRNAAENVAKYLKKGSTAFIDGTVSLDEWTDKDGKTRQTLSVKANDVKFLGSKGDGESRAATASTADFAPSHTGKGQIDLSTDDDSEIPF